MNIFYEGCMYNVIGVEFDVIHQVYKMFIKRYKCLNYWRRELGKIGIGCQDLWIYVSVKTPHVVNLSEQNKSKEEIENDIFNNALAYIKYISEPHNEDIINYYLSEMSIIHDRIDEENIQAYLNINLPDLKKLEIFNAY